MRNEFGNIFAQNVLPARTLDVGDSTWTGAVNRFVGVGGNMRGQWVATDVPHQPQTNEFEVAEARLFLLFEPIPSRLSVYIDERLAPGSASNLEAYARYRAADGHWFARAGRIYLPFGLRLEDDSAFTRTVPGINMTTPDDGVELGWQSQRWSAQVALSNGSGGGPEADTQKQVTAGGYDRASGRPAASQSVGRRRPQRVQRARRNPTGPVACWGTGAHEDDGFPEGRRTLTTLLEVDWRVAKGHNLKLTSEWFDLTGTSTRRAGTVQRRLRGAPIQFLQPRPRRDSTMASRRTTRRTAARISSNCTPSSDSTAVRCSTHRVSREDSGDRRLRHARHPPVARMPTAAQASIDLTASTAVATWRGIGEERALCSRHGRRARRRATMPTRLQPRANSGCKVVAPVGHERQDLARARRTVETSRCSAISTGRTPGAPAGKPSARPLAGIAPTTMDPSSVALSAKAASSGSAGPTRLRLITSARSSMAEAIACASVNELHTAAPLSPAICQHARSASTSTAGATPTIPWPLFPTAAMTPATSVPWRL
jgi:hypothetical protein